jgi:glycogen debranching enzyme
MSEKERPIQRIEKAQPDLEPQEKKQCKKRVLTQGTASVTQSIADAVVIKNENVFLITRPDGMVPLGGQHGFGLYYQDCRFLSGYDLQIMDYDPNALVSNAAQGFRAVLELTNPDIQLEEDKRIAMGEIGITWERLLDAGESTLLDSLIFRNFSRAEIELPISLQFEADFQDVFSIRGLFPKSPGELMSPEWKHDILSFVYKGADDLYRALYVHFSEKPQTDGTRADFTIHLAPGASKQLIISLVLKEGPDKSEIQPGKHNMPDLHGIEAYFRQISQEWMTDQVELRSDSLVLNNLFHRSLYDLRTLKTNIETCEFFAAGVPWFVTLFGRDSLITAYQMLAYNREMAAQTLRLLASYQGDEINDWRDEEPGKILHELRVGELARLGAIPHTPYYGSIDATPLFLILMARHAHWTGDLELFQDLEENVNLALEWIDRYGDLDQDGYVEYDSTFKSTQGIINQGWKDSGNCIVNADGSLAKPPIALVEVQAYVYLAKMSIAELFERAHKKDRADQLRQEAHELRTRFNQDYWMGELDTYVLALQADNEPVTAVSSNPGHALWAGIADADKAERTVKRLMQEDMYSGWGVRTLSSENPAYNPTGYHLGTVWPHDNAIIAAGFRRYRFDDQAREIFKGTIEAAMDFAHFRLPELWSGFQKSEYNVPVRYPVACHPQAWAAGSIPYFIDIFLGLQPQAFDRRLHIIRPILPDFVDRIEMRRLRVGQARVDLKFDRGTGEYCDVSVLDVEGELDVVVEAEQENGENERIA